jgi:hypothetical protein
LFIYRPTASIDKDGFNSLFSFSFFIDLPCDILTAINYHASRWGFGSCFTESTCSAVVVLSTGFNSDVSHPIRKKHITNYEQNQQNISSHPGFKKPGIPAFIPKIKIIKSKY